MRTAVASLALLAMVAIGAAACGPGERAPDSESPSRVAGSTRTLTAPAESVITPESPPASAPADDVVVRMKWCADICVPQEATVVMRDGRVVWNEPNLGVRQGRLSSAGITWVEAQLDATGLLDEPGSFDAQLRPGAQPEGGGVSLYEFKSGSPSGAVGVSAWIPGNADERDWIIPAELRTLTALGSSMIDADGWIPADLWVEPSEPYVPSQYLLLVTLNPGRTKDAIDPRAVVDVDRVLWPMPGPVDTVTPLPPGANDPRARCAVLDARVAELVDAAQRAQGLSGESRPAFADRAYLWERGGGYLTVEFQALMPDEHDCRPAGFQLD